MDKDINAPMNRKNKFIIIISIFKPTKAVKAFARMHHDWQLIVVGDKKTPKDWNFKKDVFELLYLPAFVTFRFTDILRGLVGQPLLWQQNLKLAFGTATVYQERNPHDYMKDFESETPVYIHSEKVIEIAKKGTVKDMTVAENLLHIYNELQQHSIVTEKEVLLIKARLSDLEKTKKISTTICVE